MRIPAFAPIRGVERLDTLGVVGLLALPTLIGVLLAWGLATPQDNLDRITAAVVNDDDPVTINGQTVPLGRELAAGLIGGSAGAGAPDDPTATPSPGATSSATPTPDSTPSAETTATTSVAPTPSLTPAPTTTPTATSTPGATPTPSADPTPAGSSSEPDFTWVLTNDDDAASGLLDGSYAAVVTIPASFSARATSISGAADDAQQATIQVEVAPTVAALDQALTEAVVEAAITTLNDNLTERYLSNVYEGFNQINTSVGQAATGADQLTDGTDSLSSGAGQLATGADDLASGLDTLSTGADQAATGADDLASGLDTLSTGANSLSTGADDLASGLDTLSTGADSLSTGADELASGLESLAEGAQSLSAGMVELDDSVQALPAETQELATGSAEVAAALDEASSALDGATQDAAAVVDTICTNPGPLCNRATAALGQLETADGAVAALATGADQVASGNAQLAEGIPDLVDGIDSSADGAAEVAQGADSSASGGASLADGAAEVAQGADSSASGGASVSEGASEVATGATQADTGAKQLSDGLGEAASEIPTYSADDISALSPVVTTPVMANFDTPATGSRTVPLVAVMALWVGAIVVALAHAAVARSTLLTARSSSSLALRTTGTVAAIGAGQGLAVGLVLLPFVASQAPLWAHLGSCVVVGTVFSVVNTGLAAMLGGFGRLLAALVAVVVLVVGTASTVPPAISGLAALLPTAPAHTLLLAGIGVGSGWGALVVVLLWGALGFALLVGGVVVRRRGEGLLVGLEG